jgi:hypothetical protein
MDSMSKKNNDVIEGTSYKIVSALGFFIPDVKLLLDQAVHDGREDDVTQDEAKDL